MTAAIFARPISPTLGRLRQEDGSFQASLSCIDLSQTKPKKKSYLSGVSYSGHSKQTKTKHKTRKVFVLKLGVAGTSLSPPKGGQVQPGLMGCGQVRAGIVNSGNHLRQDRDQLNAIWSGSWLGSGIQSPGGTLSGQVVVLP